MTHRDIVVIGASAGGVTALQKLLAALPESFNAIVLIVTHLAPNEPSRLPEILQAVTRMPVKAAEDNEPLKNGDRVCRGSGPSPAHRREPRAAVTGPA